MRIAYLECFSGISGDMFLGALLDAGVPFELFQKTVAGLNIGAELEHSRVDRGGISATKFDVVVNGQKDMPREEFWAQQHAGSHESEPQHAHEHDPRPATRPQSERDSAHHRRSSHQRVRPADCRRNLPGAGRSGGHGTQRPCGTGPLPRSRRGRRDRRYCLCSRRRRGARSRSVRRFAA